MAKKPPVYVGEIMKLCECGCGQLAPLAPHTNQRKGHIKGLAMRFIHGHHRRGLPSGRRVEIPKRYRIAMRNGARIEAHRLRAEKALGKPLPKGAIVHHADGSKDENAPLVICQDRAYHNLLHARMRIKAAGGDLNG